MNNKNSLALPLQAAWTTTQELDSAAVASGERLQMSGACQMQKSGKVQRQQLVLLRGVVLGIAIRSCDMIFNHKIW
jgi:hypothetical protein